MSSLQRPESQQLTAELEPSPSVDYASTTSQRVDRYLEALREDLRAPVIARSEETGDPSTSQDVAEAIFGILQRKSFTYLSKKRSNEYRDQILPLLRADVAAGEPLKFFYDIGGGYHASFVPETYELCFAPRLGELTILGQIRKFIVEVARIYPPGATFALVVDNLCARFINDIPIPLTEQYCARLRALINELNLSDSVRLIVESEQCDPAAYANPALPPLPEAISASEHDNVARFLGRDCTEIEAAQRIARYGAVCEISDRQLSAVIHGVRMTQRASPTTIGFRAFPGSDCRIQAGEVCLVVEAAKARPRLITSANAREFTLTRHPNRHLPETIADVMIAAGNRGSRRRPYRVSRVHPDQ